MKKSLYKKIMIKFIKNGITRRFKNVTVKF